MESSIQSNQNNQNNYPLNSTDFQQGLDSLDVKLESSTIYQPQRSKFASPLLETPLLDPVWKMEYFEMGASLGRGKFSSVYVARFGLKYKFNKILIFFLTK